MLMHERSDATSFSKLPAIGFLHFASVGNEEHSRWFRRRLGMLGALYAYAQTPTKSWRCDGRHTQSSTPRRFPASAYDRADLRRHKKLTMASGQKERPVGSCRRRATGYFPK